MQSFSAIEWQDPAIIEVNRLPARSYFVSYENAELARLGDPSGSNYHQSLDGSWKFSLADSPSAVDVRFAQPSFDVSDWQDIRVPGNWERQGFGKPRYVNVDYVFPADEPVVPTENNPSGSYRRDFQVPESWQDRRIVLRFGAANSGLYVWVNGRMIGYSEDSKLPAEFDITDAVKAGNNTLAALVIQWSSGSYLEDQDFWSISGLERSVELLAEPVPRIEDFFARAGLDADNDKGQLKLDIDIAAPHDGLQLRYTLTDGESTLASELVPASAQLSFESTGLDVRHWTAETPALYSLLIELLDAQGRTVQAVHRRIGFRNIEILGGRLHVNGKAITFRGVNRHEHHPVTGRVVDEQSMRRDLELLKLLNFNAVRTSHYPNSPRWFELTDEMGIYVIGEANVESHAYMGGGPEVWLGNKPYFYDSHIARMTRMLERDKNHASIIGWSLGNEAGLGKAFEDGAALIRQRDPGRSLMYEGTGQTDGHNPREFADLYTPMYDRVEEMQDYLALYPEKAIVQFEYAHAMGNSLGGLKEYWDLIWSEPMAQGGFIWDWVDQTFLEFKDDGTPYWAYGGDYDEGRNDGNFLANGIIQPDRTLNPHAWEAKKLMQPVHFELVDNRRLKVTNRHDHIGLEHLQFQWRLEADGREIGNGELDLPAIAPGDTQTIELELGGDGAAAGAELFLIAEAFAREGYQPLVPEGHRVAWEQFALDYSLPAEDWSDLNPPLTVSEDEEFIDVGGRTFSLRFDRASGLLAGIQRNDRQMLLSPLRPNFWRAPIDNDVGAGIPDALGVWRDAHTTRALESIDVRERDDRSVLISTRASYLDGQIHYESDYVILGDGSVIVHNRIEPADDAELPEFYRIGMTATLPAALDIVEWFGRGPHESYVDRKTSAAVDRYRARVSGQFHDYSRPQETGNRQDVRWLSLNDDEGLGLVVVGQPLAHIATLPFAYDELDFRPGEQRHGADLVPGELITMNIDHAQMGLGGDNSWGFWPLEQYRLPLGRYEYSFIIRAFSDGERPEIFARQTFPQSDAGRR